MCLVGLVWCDAAGGLGCGRVLRVSEEGKARGVLMMIHGDHGNPLVMDVIGPHSLALRAHTPISLIRCVPGTV